MFTIKIETDNAAFEWPHKGEEVARILREVGEQIELRGQDRGKVKDINGNTVGEWRLE